MVALANQPTQGSNALLALPSDILIIILQQPCLELTDLAAVALTCRYLNSLVDEYGWASYLRRHSRPSFSLSQARRIWSAKTHIRYDALTDSRWSKAQFVARPLSNPWHGKFQPRLAISKSRLIVAAGRTLYSYRFSTSSSDADAPSVQFEGSYTFTAEMQALVHAANHDISAVTFIDDGDADQTMLVGFADGSVNHVILMPREGKRMDVDRSVYAEYQSHQGDFIESLCSEKGKTLILSSTGFVSLIDEHHPFPKASYLDLNKRSWTSYFCPGASTPYAAFGTASSTPLAVHAISNTGIQPVPLALLYARATQLTATSIPSLASAVYAITSAPPCAPWGSSDQIIVSGWYDGGVRVHDLRSPNRTTITYDDDNGSKSHALLPVLSFADPWSPEPIYSVSCGGGSGSHIAAGTARHSVVSFWDVRYAKSDYSGTSSSSSSSFGWSVHAPGNDSSPVYSVILESSRVWGATQSRPFVYDFGPGVGRGTYPEFKKPGREGNGRSRGGRGGRNDQTTDGLKPSGEAEGSGFYVTKYSHSRTMNLSDY